MTGAPKGNRCSGEWSPGVPVEATVIRPEFIRASPPSSARISLPATKTASAPPTEDSALPARRVDGTISLFVHLEGSDSPLPAGPSCGTRMTRILEAGRFFSSAEVRHRLRTPQLWLRAGMRRILTPVPPEPRQSGPCRGLHHSQLEHRTVQQKPDCWK
jgi:hypothetical protein